MGKQIDITGCQYGRLTVSGYTGKRRGSRYFWNCKCDCGMSIEVDSASLRRGATKSCGCHRRELVTVHGLMEHELYSVWRNMRQRCTNRSLPSYKNYGGRGISICERWSDFLAFLEDVGSRPSIAHTLDRIDSNGNYEPGNVRWATRAEQNRNKRKMLISVNGRTLDVRGWAIAIGVSREAIYERIKNGQEPKYVITSMTSRRVVKDEKAQQKKNPPPF